MTKLRKEWEIKEKKSLQNELNEREYKSEFTKSIMPLVNKNATFTIH